MASRFYICCCTARRNGGICWWSARLSAFDRAWMLQHPTRSSPVGEKGRAVVLGGHSHADCAFRHRNQTIAHQPVKPEPWDIQHISRRKPNARPLARGFIAGGLVLVIEPARIVAPHTHAIGHQRIQADDLIAAVADDLRVGVTPQQQMRHQRLAEDEAGHLRVEIIVQQPVEHVVGGLDLRPVLLDSIDVQRQARDRLSQDPHARIHGGHLHRTTLGDRAPGAGGTEQEAVARGQLVLRSPSGIGATKPVKESHVNTPFKLRLGEST